MLLAGILVVSLASAGSSQGTLKTDVTFEFNDSNSQRMKLPDFSPQTFDTLRNDPSVLATKGKIPQYATQAERLNWLDKLDNIRVLADDDLSPYAYPNGPLLAHGFGENGTVEVYLYKGMNVTDSQINEIYNVISKIGNTTNTQDVPVIFYKIDLIEDVVSGYDTKYRNPVIGAIQLTGETKAIGTLGFAAKTSSGTKGYVTAQHLGTSIGYKMYQPTKKTNNGLGSVSKTSSTHADACFVPYSNVAAKIHIGGGKTLPVVTYMSSKPKSSWVDLHVYKSGRTTGVTDGKVVSIIDIDNNLGKYYGLIKTTIPVETGDSGGPLYTMPTSGKSCNILGITKATVSGGSLYSSVYGINYDLGVLPITT